jgi:large subunit ribosomal protein L24
MKIKKGDNIIVLSGKDKGKKGKIEEVFSKERKVLVLGINVVKKHERARKGGQKGQIVDRPMPMHASKVSLLDPQSGKATRAGYKMVGDKKVRIARASGMEV